MSEENYGVTLVWMDGDGKPGTQSTIDPFDGQRSLASAEEFGEVTIKNAILWLVRRPAGGPLEMVRPLGMGFAQEE